MTGSPRKPPPNPTPVPPRTDRRTRSRPGQCAQSLTTVALGLHARPGPDRSPKPQVARHLQRGGTLSFKAAVLARGGAPHLGSSSGHKTLITAGRVILGGQQPDSPAKGDH